MPVLKRFMLTATASALSFSPSEKVTSSRRVRVRVVWASSYSNAVASQGSMVFSGVATSRVSYTAW